MQTKMTVLGFSEKGFHGMVEFCNTLMPLLNEGFPNTAVPQRRRCTTDSFRWGQRPAYNYGAWAVPFLCQHLRSDG